MSALAWSTSPPTANGIYWLRRHGVAGTTVVKVYDCPRDAYVAFVGSDWDRELCDVIAEWRCEWAGPLAPPAA